MNQTEIFSILRQFKKLNQDKYKIVRIGLFGSVARGELSEMSDVDVVVELEKPDLFSLIGIKQDLEDQLRRTVDIIRYRDRMNLFLKGRIDKEAVYV